MRQIELSAGIVEYIDSAPDDAAPGRRAPGAGAATPGHPKPAVVLLHGLLMDSSLWDGVIAELGREFRCIAPTLPMGAHRQPMDADADLSLPGIARLVAELIERLDLNDVTLVGNDTGGALVQLLIAADPAGTDTPAADAAAARVFRQRVGRVVLASCEAFDNVPPGLTGRTLVRSGRLSPALFGLFMQQMRIRPMRRLPLAFGWLTRRGDSAAARWVRPVIAQSGIRRDAVRTLRSIGKNRRLLIAAAERLPSFAAPALVVWASEDRVMPPEHGHRLAELLPRGRLVEVEDSYTLIPLDQPAAFARHLRAFAGVPVG
jgi:pimeloyl-ACP methyl ester carboxylesterase